MYIGESFDIERRWNQHKQDLINGCHHNYYLQQSFNNYGKKYFSFKVLQKINTEELEKTHANIIEALLLMLESSYIKKFSGRKYCVIQYRKYIGRNNKRK